MSDDQGTLPFMSVIVPTRDRPDLLEGALESILDQSYPPEGFEVLVCEDGGSERSRHVVGRLWDERAALGGPELRWIGGPQGGINSARNRGWAEARGDLIVFTDDDVLAPKGWLRELAEGASRHGSAGCLGGPVRIRYEGRRPRACDRHAIWKGEVELDIPEGPMTIVRLIGANLAVRRSAFELIGGFDERVAVGAGADAEWQHRYIKHGGQVVYLPRALLWHRRTRQMTRFSSSLIMRFRRGFNEVLHNRNRGMNTRSRDQLRRVYKLMKHSLRLRCTVGLFEAATALGHSVGLLFDRWGLHPRTSHLPRPK
jgi:GT2 family glycosyltransferase